MKSHYRSTLADFDTITTGIVATDLITKLYQARKIGGQPFWVPAGGALALDDATSVPEFQDDIIMRGGLLNFTVANHLDTADTDITVKVWLFRSDETPDYPATSVTQPRDWDPTCYPDSHRRLGKMLLSRTALLKTGDSLKVQWRMRIEKIDQQDYMNNNKEYYWMVGITTNGTVNDGVNIITSFNLSFSGDVRDI